MKRALAAATVVALERYRAAYGRHRSRFPRPLESRPALGAVLRPRGDRKFERPLEGRVHEFLGERVAGPRGDGLQVVEVARRRTVVGPDVPQLRLDESQDLGSAIRVGDDTCRSGPRESDLPPDPIYIGTFRTRVYN